MAGSQIDRQRAAHHEPVSSEAHGPTQAGLARQEISTSAMA
jgi:hypothetical protein